MSPSPRALPGPARRTVGIRGQLMWFLCCICLFLLGLFWFLSTQLLEPLYTRHIQKQATAQAEAVVAELDAALAEGETVSFRSFGHLFVNDDLFDTLRKKLYENNALSGFCVDIADSTLRQVFREDNLPRSEEHTSELQSRE